MNKFHIPLKRGEHAPRPLQRFGIRIEAYQPATPGQPLADLHSMSCTSDGRINICERRIGKQQGERLIAENRNMIGKLIHAPPRLFLKYVLCYSLITVGLRLLVHVVDPGIPELDPFQHADDQHFIFN